MRVNHRFQAQNKASAEKMEIMKQGHQELKTQTTQHQEATNSLWEKRMSDSNRREQNQHQLMLTSMLLGHQQGGQQGGPEGNIMSMLRGLLGGSGSSSSSSQRHLTDSRGE